MTKQKLVCIGVLTFFLVASLSASGVGAHPSLFVNDDFAPFFTSDLVRIDTTTGDASLPRGIEIVGGNTGKWIDIIIPHGRLSELSQKDLSYSVLIEDIDSYSAVFTGQYHTFPEIEQILQDTADNYPSITRLFSLGKSYEDRDMWCLEISDNPGVDEEEPGVFFMGLHHAREWPTVEICLTIINRLTSLYSSNITIQNLVNNRRIWIVPCSNPDGYAYSHDQSHDWRKNRHYFSEYGSTGVDLNRNYGGSSNGNPWGAWGSVHQGAATHNPPYETYCGPAPMSELEIQAIGSVFLENDICASITWHTYSELVMWPWGHLSSEHAPDNSYLSDVGHEIASRITKQSGSGTYTPQQSARLYPTTGDTTDWAYGYAHYVLGKTTFAFTIEACSDFHPSADKLDQICAENFDGALYLLQEAENISTTVVPRVLPPVIDDLPNDPDGTYTVSWQEQNPAANPDVFQLEELTGLTVKTDDAETNSTLWNLDGFTRSTQRAHSASYSYKSGNVSNDVSALTSVFPLPVTDTTTLSFWCWYDIEPNWDYAFVEVSTNGRSYDVLDSFTGTSSDWTFKEYPLNAYAGQSIFIRFRYTTDEETTKEGFYVDDITPVSHFYVVTNLSDSITETHYEVTGKANGTYYYQVRGHNTERGWGDYSNLRKVLVGTGNDEQPPIIEMTSPKQRYVYFGGREMFPFFVTLIFGYVTIEANTSDAFGIDHVEFSIDDTTVGIDTTAPYSMLWETPAFFRHTIKIISYDTSGNTAETELKVWKFL